MLFEESLEFIVTPLKSLGEQMALNARALDFTSVNITRDNFTPKLIKVSHWHWHSIYIPMLKTFPGPDRRQISCRRCRTGATHRPTILEVNFRSAYLELERLYPTFLCQHLTRHGPTSTVEVPARSMC